MSDLISRQAAIDAVRSYYDELDAQPESIEERIERLPSAQPELIEKVAYIRGFEQGRTQGMIDNTIKAEWTNADALDLQPTCNQLATDVISRQAAIDWLSKEWNGMVWTVFDGIRALPSAEPERKKGKWIVYKAPDKYHCGLVKCPFCFEEGIAEADEYNFCPNCGADMRGEE